MGQASCCNLLARQKGEFYILLLRHHSCLPIAIYQPLISDRLMEDDTIGHRRSSFFAGIT